MEFWLEKGLDGFRVDTVNMYSKPLDFPDAPIVDPNSDIQPAGMLYCNGPEMHKYCKEMGAILNRYDAMTVGELPNTPDAKKVFEYVSLANKELSMVFAFEIVDLGRSALDVFKVEKHKLTHFKSLVSKWQNFIRGNDAWNSIFIENHDQGRSLSRFANDSLEYRRQSSKMMSLLILAQTGTPFIYQGQELGMTNIPVDWPEKEYLDVMMINYLARLRSEGASEEEIKKQWPMINLLARDNARTPVQWSDADHGGFSTSKPWMRVNDNYKSINAAEQLQDPNSVYHFWQNVISLRKEHLDIFTYGDFDLYDADSEAIFSFIKTASSGQKAFITLNFSTESQPLSLPKELDLGKATKVLSPRPIKDNAGPLEACEGRVYIF